MNEASEEARAVPEGTRFSDLEMSKSLGLSDTIFNLSNKSPAQNTSYQSRRLQRKQHGSGSVV